MNAVTIDNEVVTSRAGEVVASDATVHVDAVASGASAPPLSIEGDVQSKGFVAGDTRGTAAPSRYAGVLLAATPARWYEVACERWRELLVDHANCEKKAASTALSLIFSYPEDMALTDKMSRLAREELRHFEQVQKLMQELKVPFSRMQPSRYGAGLRAATHRAEPERLLDLLLCGALIEARSCERFEGLGPLLTEPLRGFYTGLAVSEARHQSLYLRLAEQRAGDIDWRARLQQLAEIEADLATSPDEQFRFHSGSPAF
ncbi:tRNA-(ms[2]io[6]A)-hydroxylase [Steroidobacter flavus]|uniref:tRNA-(Ms[2]io[6]A)-hydroxylase n=1 Tax=Steroidobacter flavus TaxID=1842136 RepID=A0ABV8T7V2_9GAMM